MTDAPSELLEKPFRFYLRRHRRMAVLGLICLFITNALETVVPWLVGQALDKILAGQSVNAVGTLVLKIFAVIVLLSAFRYMWRIFWSQFHHAAAEDLRNRLFERMTFLGAGFFKGRKIGQLITLISNDVNSFRMGIGPGLLLLFDGLFTFCLIFPVMVSISWTWTWQTLVLMPFVPFLVRAILSRLQREYHTRQETFADMSGTAQEIVSGIRVIKSFAQEDNQTRLFNEQSEKFRAACDRVSRWDAFFGPALELPVALGSVVLLILGAPEVIAGRVSLGQFFAFYQYIQRMIWPMSAVGVGLGHVQEARASFLRIRETLQMQTDVPDTGVLDVERFESLEVRGLSFSYPGAKLKALDNISFVLRRGECLGIVGMTGAGKSTLVDLVLRHYPVPPDTILINGISVEKIRLQSLRKLLGIVPQEAFLFSRKVSENLGLGLERWEFAEVQTAARNVHLDHEIESWPEGYNALIGERGVNLSGGQKQRLTLARALMRDADLVVLDDSLSAVDSKTESVILNNLRAELGRRSSIVVSHRLASVKGADVILVLKEGRVEATGRHEDLMRTSPTYQVLAEMQGGLPRLGVEP